MPQAAVRRLLEKGAFDDQANKIGQTWLFAYKKKDVIGYVTIAMAYMSKREHGKLEHFPHSNVPVFEWIGSEFGT